MSEVSEFGKPSLAIRGYDPALDLDRCMEIWREASEAGHPFLGAAALDSDASVVREHYMPADSPARIRFHFWVRSSAACSLIPRSTRRGSVVRW